MSERELLTKLALLSSENVRLKEINQKLKKQNANLRIRKLTPKECWRLMGFSDELFEKAQIL